MYLSLLKPYVLVFDLGRVTRQQILDFLDTRSEIKHWYAFLPSAVFIISDIDAHKLSEAIQQGFPNVNFVITEVPHGNINGWLAKDAWEFINNPKSSGRWP